MESSLLVVRFTLLLQILRNNRFIENGIFGSLAITDKTTAEDVKGQGLISVLKVHLCNLSMHVRFVSLYIITSANI